MSATIENICSDFFTFWQQAKARSFEEQFQLWKSLYEACHQEVLASYYQDFPQTQMPERIEQAFQRFGEVVPQMQQWAPRIEPMIVRATNHSASLFEVTHFVLPYVVMVGWFISDGWSSDTYQGKRASFVALEELARSYPVSSPHHLEILLIHEAAHAHHSHCNGNTWRQYHIGEALFLEGMAVLATQQALAGLTEAEYLCFHAGYQPWLAACEQQWPTLRAHLLQDFDLTERACYASYFQLSGKSPFPLRSGYFAGYRAVRSLNKQYSLIEMAHWDRITAAEKLRRVLHEE